MLTAVPWPYLLILPLLGAVALSDLRWMRIPNWMPLAAVALFFCTAVFLPPADLLPRLGIAGIVFGAGFTAFALRLVGGGDVKMLAALMLFIPSSTVLLFANIFAVSLLLGIVAVLSLRRILPTNGHAWKAFSGTTGFPMGISIALAGIAHLGVLALFGDAAG
jgi:prepilin peptidase CpaA